MKIRVLVVLICILVLVVSGLLLGAVVVRGVISEYEKTPENTSIKITPSSTEKPVTAKPIKVSGFQLKKEIKANEIQALLKYEDQPVIMTGEITSIHLMSENLAAITLEKTITCYFERKEFPSIAKLKKGKKIQILGVFASIKLLVVEQCKINKGDKVR